MSLTTLTAARRQLGMSLGQTSDDDLITLYIDRASQFIESFCERKIEQATYTELHHGRRQNILLPREFPITAVTEIRISQDRDWVSSDTLIDSTKYVIADFDTSIVYDCIFPTGYSNVRIIYTAGYTTVPADIEMACLWLVEWYFRHRERGDIGRTSLSKGDESVGVVAEMPAMISQILMNYKRTEVAPTNSPVRNL